MKERAVKIGTPTPLIGVISEPDAFDPARPAVIIMNSGVMHHVGSCRLSVKIARAVADQGLLALRFDYSGIGDSEPRRGSSSFDELSVTECAEVMNYLQRTRGVQQFVLYGLCSGADAAYNTALADARVIAISQIDPYSYRTGRYHAVRVLDFLSSPSRVGRFLVRRLRSLVGRGAATATAAAAIDGEFLEIPTYTRIFPPREQVAAGLAKLVARGVKVQALFMGTGEYNHVGQFRDSFRDVPFGDLLSVEYFPQSDHIVTHPRMQREVVGKIVTWLVEACRPQASADRHRAA